MWDEEVFSFPLINPGFNDQFHVTLPQRKVWSMTLDCNFMPPTTRRKKILFCGKNKNWLSLRITVSHSAQRRGDLKKKKKENSCLALHGWHVLYTLYAMYSARSLPLLSLSNQQFRLNVFTADARSKLKAVADRETYGPALCKRKSTAKINW